MIALSNTSLGRSNFQNRYSPPLPRESSEQRKYPQHDKRRRFLAAGLVQ